MVIGGRVSKPKRNYFKGGIYHIIHRGNNRAYIFDDHLDKAFFLSLIKVTMIKMPFDVLYYVIMDNHYHILLRMNEIPIDKIMCRINTLYSKYYNKKYNRSGTIFGTRPGSIHIKDTRQYMSVILYNAYNPVKAKIVKHPEQYKWCAHLEVISKNQYIVNREKTLELIDNNPSKAMAIYEDLLNEKIKGFKREKSQDEIREIRNEVMMTMLLEITNAQSIADAILKGDRQSSLMSLKKCFIKTLYDKGFVATEIALFLNMSAKRIRELRCHSS